VSVSTAVVDTRVASAYREAWSVCRAHPTALLIPGAILFLLFGLPSVLAGEVTTDQGAGALVTAFTGQILGFTSSFLYYGYCEELADQVRRTDEVSVRHALDDTRRVLLKLIAVSVVVEILVVIGLLLLIIPGLLLATLFGLVAPIASFERLWPRRAMKRSIELVQGHARLVALTAVAMFALEQVASSLGEALGADVAGDHLLGAVLGDALGDLLVGPFAGVLIAIVYFRLSGRHTSHRHHLVEAPA
jgi:hypothetical protein